MKITEVCTSDLTNFRDPAVSTPEKLGELLKDLPGVAASCKEKYEKAREQICPRDDGKACNV